MRTFKLFWDDGTEGLVSGNTIKDALHNAGISLDAMGKLFCWQEIEPTEKEEPLL